MNTLTSIEKRQLMQVAESSPAIDTLPSFKAWIRGPVNEYFPHEKAICVAGQLLGNQIHVKHLIGVNYPLNCIERLDRIIECSERRMIQRWLSLYRAQVFNAMEIETQFSRKEKDEARLLGVTNFASHGCLDIAGKGGTYVSFSNLPGMLAGQHAHKLELVMPYLHQALTRVFHNASTGVGDVASRCAQLTKREREILSLMTIGLSNRAIAARLFRSELTVQNHAHAIFRKLGVNSRAAAVAFINRDGCHDCRHKTDVPGSCVTAVIPVQVQDEQGASGMHDEQLLATPA
jgi:transcriptional regulator EpsA